MAARTPAAIGWAALVLGVLAYGRALAGQQSKVERLGYPAGTRLLIVHGDDMGMAHAQNAATFAALEAGGASSGSVLVPAPWAPEAIAWARQHPDADIGIHLTLTAEWPTLRWGGVLSRKEVPSLYDAQGFLPATTEAVARQARADQAEKELRAQLARARELGLRPTHLDMHMAGVMVTPEIFAAYLRVARENRIPAMIPAELLRNPQLMGIAPGLAELVRPDEVLVDHYVMAMGNMTPEQLAAFYTNVLKNLEPGTITQLIVHLGYDDAEMRAVTAGQVPYGASWRQHDVDFFTSAAAKSLLAENGIRLTTWRELSKLLPPQS